MIPFLPILIPLLTAIAGLALRRNLKGSRFLNIAGSVLLLVSTVYLLFEVQKTPEAMQVVYVGSWAAPFGISLVADLLSVMMLIVSAVIAVAVAIYGAYDLEDKWYEAYFVPLFQILMMGVNGAFLTGDLFNLYVWFEVMLIASFVLMVLGGGRKQLEGGVKYFVLNLFSSVLFLAGIGLIYGKLGTLNMADIAATLASSETPDATNSSVVLLLIAFGIKSGLFPLFFWLPASYHTPTFSVSALFAGLLTKVGVYAMIRAFTLIFHPVFPDFQEILLVVAVATMVTGVFGAATQMNIRRILSFHIISQIGYMILGLALLTPLALAGAVFYVVHHIIVKANLFLIGGIIARKTGSEDLKQIGGLFKSAPALAILFLIPALSLGGIPPLSGFWAKFSLVKAGLGEAAYIAIGAALLVGIFTLYSMTKIWAQAFWKAHPKPDGVTRPPVGGLLAPAWGLAVLTLIISFFGAPLFELSQQAAEQLLNPEMYIQAVLEAEPAPGNLANVAWNSDE